MSKRNIYFGGFSLLVAGAAIAGGAAVSSSAMADSGTPTDELNTISVISWSEGGEAIECTFDGVDFPSFVINSAQGDGVIAVTGTATIAGGLPAGELPELIGEAVPMGEGESFSVSVGGDGVITDSDGNVIESGTLVAEGGVTVEAGELVPLTPEEMEAMGGEFQVISADDARPGTPEECAAMQPMPATQVNPEG